MIVESTAAAEDEETILAKYSKYHDLDDLQAAVAEDTGSRTYVTFGRRNKIVWVETPDLVLIGTYRYDDETGKYYVKLQSVKLSKL